MCTVYPMDGYFIALIVTNERDRTEAEALMSGCSDYVRSLFEKTPYFRGSKWLMVEVKERDALQDVKSLLALRAK